MNAVDHSHSFWVWRTLEWFFAFVGTAACVWVAITFAAQQPDQLWPAPGFYFLEILILAALVLISRVLDSGPGKFDYGLIPWTAGGVLFPLVILGIFSIGPFLFPAMLSFWIAALIGDLCQGRAILSHLGLTLATVFFQAGLMGLILLFSSPR